MLALRPVAFAIGLIDAPGGRKFHAGEVPITGGLAMFAAIFIATSFLSLPDAFLPSFFIASLILVIVGMLDDRFHLSAAERLLSQIAAVLLMYFGAGLGLTDIGNPFGLGVIETGRAALVVTMLIFVSMINAYNFVDGADGLAGSLSLIGSVVGHGRGGHLPPVRRIRIGRRCSRSRLSPVQLPDDLQSPRARLYGRRR